MKWDAICAGLVVTLVTVVPVEAKPRFPTAYTYYLVSGSTQGEVFKSLSRRGPVFKGMRAYASTSITNARQTGKLVSDGRVCRAKGYSFETAFEIKLPKLKDGSKLSGAPAKNWRGFVAFAKRHEEEHRAIWLGCWNGFSKKVAAISKPDCSAVEREIDRLLKSHAQSCQKKHDQLDARDQVALRKLPFIKQSLREQ